MQKALNFSHPSDKEVWITVLLIQPSKGINNKKNKKFFKHYKQEDIKVYRDIFLTNNAKTIAKFF